MFLKGLGTPRAWRAAGCAVAFMAVSSVARAQSSEAEAGWPRELVTDSGTMVVFQPQPDRLDGMTLTARAAVSVVLKGATQPVFGVVWFTARTQTERDDRTAYFDQLVVTNIRFPGLEADRERRFRALVNPEIEHWQFTMELDRFTASLAQVEAEQRSVERLSTVPPQVIFSTTPAALLIYDGEPILRPIEGTSVQRAVNTPLLVVFDHSGRTFYLNGGPLWYSSRAALGPWSSMRGPPPPNVARLVPDSLQRDSVPPSGPPRIVVATVPTELVVTDGAPNWAPITGTDLLYVTNTERDVFRTIDDPKMYVLLAGRWFRAATEAGPWAYVPPDSLPAVFRKVAPESPKGDVRASVAGTEEADEAVLDTYVPQTAAIDRATTKLTVSYAGQPEFDQIPGTAVQYATNSDASVLKIGSRYYACDQAVWFESPASNGPWAVADSVPAAVETIPPTAPVYNVRYVKVYQATPQVVFVGYTPGYMWSFPMHGTVVFGTGFVYRPFISPVVFIPRPVTFGVGMRWNPWTGWTMGFGFGSPFLHVGAVVGPPMFIGGWWGPWGRPMWPPPFFRPPFVGFPGWRPMPMPPMMRPPMGGRPPMRPMPLPGNNIYNRPQNRPRNVPPQAIAPPRGQPVNRGPNNVYAGRDGNVYRRNGQNWQTRDNNQWRSTPPAVPPAAGQRPNVPTNPGGAVTRPANPTAPVTRPAPGPTMPTTRPTAPAARPSLPPDVNRDFQSRQRGQQATQNWNNTASRAPQQRPAAPQSRSAPQARPSSGAARR